MMKLIKLDPFNLVPPGEGRLRYLMLPHSTPVRLLLVTEIKTQHRTRTRRLDELQLDRFPSSSCSSVVRSFHFKLFCLYYKSQEKEFKFNFETAVSHHPLDFPPHRGATNQGTKFDCMRGFWLDIFRYFKRRRRGNGRWKGGGG